MLIEEYISIKVNNHSIKHYISLGYKCNMWDTIIVKTSDLPPNSQYKVHVICDYCGKEYETRFHLLTRGRKDINKDCCYECRGRKNEEIMLKKYGVKNAMLVDSFKDNQITSLLKHYGVENPLKNKEIANRTKNTIIQKYGTDNVMKVPEILKKQRTSADTSSLRINGVKVSRNQYYLSKLFDGEINKKIDGKCVDIFFDKYNTYIEYDGSGHNLSVVMHRESEKDFFDKENSRDLYLISLGYNCIRIISKDDLLPKDDVLLGMFRYAINLLSNNNVHRIIYNVTDKYILIENEIVEYDYSHIL